MKIQSIRGFNDIYLEEGEIFYKIRKTIEDVALKNNFSILELPILEYSSIFERSAGETSDVVSKEIYKFKDKGENELALRPEFTASVARFFLEHSLENNILPQRYFSFGPVFRYNRPQLGRYRQFYQANFENFLNKVTEFEIRSQLEILTTILEKYNLLSNSLIKINHLSNEETRKIFEDEFKNKLSERKNELSEDSQIRLEKNPLKILDSKDKNDLKISEEAGVFLRDFYKNNELEILNRIKNYFLEKNIKIEIDDKLVRGLDYYSGFVFEIEDIEKGYSICGGGEYSGLLSKMSGRKMNVANFGFAIGIDRLIIKIKEQEKTETSKKLISFIYDEKNSTNSSLLEHLKQEENDFIFEIFPANKIQNGIEKAIKLNSKFALIKFENEITENKIIIKNLETREQIELEDLKENYKILIDFLNKKNI